jgi:hypothetical protein
VEAPEARVAGTGGRVVAAADGSPVAKAAVHALAAGAPGEGGEPLRSETDLDGRFTLEGQPHDGQPHDGQPHDGQPHDGQPPAIRALLVDHPAFLPAVVEGDEIEPSSPAGEPIELVIALERGRGLQGMVIDADTLEPIAGAEVMVRVLEGVHAFGFPEVWRRATTGADGRFELAGLCARTYLPHVRARGYLSPVVEVDVGGVSDPLSIPLEPAAGVSGRILDAERRPVAGASVFTGWSRRPGLPLTSSAVSNWVTRSEADGRYEFDCLTETADYAVFATHAEHAWGHAEGIVLGRKERRENVDILLRRGGDIRGRVLDSAGGAVERAEVSARPDPVEVDDQDGEDPLPDFLVHDPSARRSTLSGADGHFLLAHLAPGAYVIWVEAAGHLGAGRSSVQVEDGELVGPLDFVLDGAATLAVRVRDSAGRPLAGAKVSAGAAGQPPEPTDADGRARLCTLSPGPATVHAWLDGYEAQTAQTVAPGPELVLVLKRLARIRGALRGPAGCPLAEIVVIVTSLEAQQSSTPLDPFPLPSGEDPGQACEVDAGGLFHGEFREGRYKLAAVGPGFISFPIVRDRPRGGAGGRGARHRPGSPGAAPGDGAGPRHGGAGRRRRRLGRSGGPSFEILPLAQQDRRRWPNGLRHALGRPPRGRSPPRRLEDLAPFGPRGTDRRGVSPARRAGAGRRHPRMRAPRHGPRRGRPGLRFAVRRGAGRG